MPCHGPVMFNENLSRGISVATYWHDLDFLPKKLRIFEFWKNQEDSSLSIKNDAHTFRVGVFSDSIFVVMEIWNFCTIFKLHNFGKRKISDRIVGVIFMF